MMLATAFVLLVGSGSLAASPCRLGAVLPVSAPPLAQDPGAVGTEEARVGRLSAIAQALQDPATDAVALATEAVRLVGFTVWSEDRAVLAEPTGAPRLHLAITDIELRAYAQMFRDGHTVSRDDLVGGLDVLYRGLFPAEAGLSVAPATLAWLRDGTNNSNPSARALAVFLQDLAVHRAGAGRLDGEADLELDPIQALLMLRVLTEDLGTPLRRAIGRGEVGEAAKDGGKEDEPREAPRGPFVAAESGLGDDPPGWAEDAYVGGITGLFGEVVGNLGKWGKGISDGLGKANAISSIAKFVATYTFLKGEVRVEEPGQPLVRTKDRDPGQQRTLVARFFIDGTRVTDWMKENRQLVALAGLDLDMPKTGALKGVETNWDIAQDRHSSKYHLIQTVRGQPDISKVKTDENGEARIRVEGTPQPRQLDPNAVMPIEKSVRLVVTPQVKSTEMQQDLVDAVTGAIGIKGGPSGFLTPVIECLYRMKWKGGRWFVLQVRDWQPAETIGQGSIEIRASGNSFTRTSALRMNISRTLKFTDIGMQAIGVEPPPPLDPNLIKFMPPAIRKQMEDGMKQMAELAKKRMFMAEGPGLAELHIHDSSAGFGEEDGCGDDSVEFKTTWDGDRSGEWKELDGQFGPAMFTVDVDLEKRTATLQMMMRAETKVVSITKKRKGKSETREEIEAMDVFAGLQIAPPYQRSLVIPLKETEVRDMSTSNYYGVVSVPFSFGPGGKFKGTALVSYSVTRKLKPK